MAFILHNISLGNRLHTQTDVFSRTRLCRTSTIHCIYLLWVVPLGLHTDSLDFVNTFSSFFYLLISASPHLPSLCCFCHYTSAWCKPACSEGLLVLELVHNLQSLVLCAELFINSQSEVTTLCAHPTWFICGKGSRPFKIKALYFSSIQSIATT